MRLCIVKKMMSKAILTMVLVGIGLLMSAFSRGRVMMVSAAETTSTTNTVDGIIRITAQAQSVLRTVGMKVQLRWVIKPYVQEGLLEILQKVSL